jgi:predicted enzyme related to lactoylglutathione lyase
MNLNSVLIGSEDPARLVAYYTKLFGEPTWDEGGYTGWMLGQGAVTVGPHSEVKGRNAEPGRIIWNVETPDVRGTFERFRGAGATVVQEPYTMEGMEADDAICTFEDPDGNYFQLMSPMGPPEGS